ncbi:T9SS type A sorting domain-containing protein [bacterium]|nr:T9SS type A sorting domain-containing protein [bacterium]
MKKIFLALIVMAFGLAGLKTVLAGDVTVVIRDGSIGNGQSGKLGIAVFPNVPVAGIQIMIAFQTDQVTVREAEIDGDPKGFQIHSNIKNGTLKTLIFNLSGGVYGPEDEVVINVPLTPVGGFTGFVLYELKELILAGEKGQVLEVDRRLGTIEVSLILPRTFRVESSYPNPFNASTVINYELPRDAIVSARIYSINGQLVIELENHLRKAGYYQLIWDGRDAQHKPVSSGEYFLVFQAGEFQYKHKMLFLK